jgi:hypothetical protein
MTSNAYSATVTRTAEPQADHHRRDHERAVGDGDDLGQAPDMRIAEYVLDDITADEYVNAAEGDDVAEDRDHADPRPPPWCPRRG